MTFRLRPQGSLCSIANLVPGDFVKVRLIGWQRLKKVETPEGAPHRLWSITTEKEEAFNLCCLDAYAKATEILEESDRPEPTPGAQGKDSAKHP